MISKKMLAIGTLISGAIALTACSTTPTTKATAKPTGQGKPQAVASVDLNRYMGKWYEIGRLPMFFQRNCASDVTATYTLKSNGAVEVNNQCIGKDGKSMQSIGEATKNGETGSQLKVTFLPKGLRSLPIGKADYWVLDLDQNYQYALVGTPNNKYLWILSRTPTMSEATYQNLLATAKSQGFDVSKIIRTPHER
ncbi:MULTISPECIES: lipocalin family protein [unclassified Moraxella]|uniref:lipocalin family protein n=1 Tax=unclassified Moraxella TaxID=2685852 RepID=UPI003AF7656D